MKKIIRQIFDEINYERGNKTFILLFLTEKLKNK